MSAPVKPLPAAGYSNIWPRIAIYEKGPNGELIHRPDLTTDDLPHVEIISRRARNKRAAEAKRKLLGAPDPYANDPWNNPRLGK